MYACVDVQLQSIEGNEGMDSVLQWLLYRALFDQQDSHLRLNRAIRIRAPYQGADNGAGKRCPLPCICYNNASPGWLGTRGARKQTNGNVH